MTLIESAEILKDEAIRHFEIAEAYRVALDAIVELAELKEDISKTNTILDEIDRN